MFLGVVENNDNRNYFRNSSLNFPSKPWERPGVVTFVVLDIEQVA